MPGIYDTPSSRRNFLAASAAAAGLLGTLSENLNAEEPTPGTRLALLSDTHIPAEASNGYRGFVPADNLQLVVDQVRQTQIQAAIINGDAARLVGEREDYVELKRLLKPVAERAPIHIGLGNHDDRKNFFNVFPPSDGHESLVQGKHVSTFALGGTRFVVLDSLLYVNKVAGLLGKSQRQWLAEFLESADKSPVVFFVHHTLGDGDGDLLDFERVFQILKSHKHVKAIFYGHSHRYHVDQREHIYLINQPAVGYNFNDRQPVGWLDATFSPTGVDLKLNAVGGNTDGDSKTTTIAWS